MKKRVLLVEEPMVPGEVFDERIAAALDLERGLPYSRDISAAWQVAVAMGVDYSLFHLHHVPADSWYPDGFVSSHWECQFEDGPEMEAVTVAHAICLAALHCKYQIQKG